MVFLLSGFCHCCFIKYLASTFASKLSLTFLNQGIFFLIVIFIFFLKGVTMPTAPSRELILWLLTEIFMEVEREHNAFSIVASAEK